MAADAAEGVNDKDGGKDGGYAIFDVGLAYGWYLADNVEATAPCGGNMVEEEVDTELDVIVGANEEESRDVWRTSDADRLVCVFKCIRSSSLLTNLFPQ